MTSAKRINKKKWVLRCNALDIISWRSTIERLFGEYRNGRYMITFFQKIPESQYETSCSKWGLPGQGLSYFMLPLIIPAPLALPKSPTQKKLKQDVEDRKVASLWQILRHLPVERSQTQNAFYLLGFRTGIAAASLAFLTNCAVFEAEPFLIIENGQSQSLHSDFRDIIQPIVENNMVEADESEFGAVSEQKILSDSNCLTGNLKSKEWDPVKEWFEADTGVSCNNTVNRFYSAPLVETPDKIDALLWSNPTKRLFQDSTRFLNTNNIQDINRCHCIATVCQGSGVSDRNTPCSRVEDTVNTQTTNIGGLWNIIIATFELKGYSRDMLIQSFIQAIFPS